MACTLKMLLCSSLLLFLSTFGSAQSCTGVLGSVASGLAGIGAVQSFCVSNYPAPVAGTVTAPTSTSTILVGTSTVTSTVTSTSTTGTTTQVSTVSNTVTTVSATTVSISVDTTLTVTTTAATVTVTAAQAKKRSVHMNKRQNTSSAIASVTQSGSNNARLICSCIEAGLTVTTTPVVTSSITATSTSLTTTTSSVQGTATSFTTVTGTVTSVSTATSNTGGTVTKTVSLTLTITTTAAVSTTSTTTTTSSSASPTATALDYSCSNIGKFCNGGQSGSCYCQYEAQAGQGVCVSLNDRSNSIRCTSTAGCPNGQRCITGTQATTTNGFCYPLRAQCARVNSAKFLFARKIESFGDY